MPSEKSKSSKKSTSEKKSKSLKSKQPSMSKTVLASNHFSNQKKDSRSKPKKTKGETLLKRLLSWLKTLPQKIIDLLKFRKRKKKDKKDKRNKKEKSLAEKKPLYKRFLKYIFSLRGVFLFIKIFIVLIVIAIAAFASLYLHYRKDIPASVTSLQSCIDGQTTQYYDKTGDVLLWSSKSDIDCQPIQTSDVSQYLIDALIIMEDQDFYNHRGVKPSSILRATWNNIFNKESTQGGSTITQQYIKNAILQDRSRELSRKFKELILAIELERTFTKDEILTAYLNTVSFGSIYSGIEAASHGYFGKSAKDLTADEAALLVAALPAPTTYWNNPERHLSRQQLVLRTMLTNGLLTQAEYDEAIAIKVFDKVITSHKQYENIIAPHFILETEKRLINYLCQDVAADEKKDCESIRLKGYKIITTLDIQAQRLAEKSVEDVIPTIKEKGFDNAAAVAVDVDSGKVLALVGSRDFEYPVFGQNNTVTEKRDPGSTFKLFDYAALIENSTDWGPGSIFYDYETTFDNRGWTPENYNRRHNGPLTMRRALGQSLNIPAIKAMYIAGVDTVHQLAQDVGIKGEFPCEGGCGLASAFGSGVEVRLDELTNSYATFSRSGTYLPLSYINRVEDKDGNVLLEWQRQPEKIVSSETAYLLNHMLADSSVRYTQSFNLDPSLRTTMAVKTGTDDKFVNNHIVGYTKSVAFGAWMGHHDEATEFETERFTTPPKALMLKTFMEAYHRNLPYEQKNEWPRPRGIKEITIDSITGYQADKNPPPKTTVSGESLTSRSRTDIFPSWYIPKIPAQLDNTVVTVDRVTGRRATECTPQSARFRGPIINILNEITHDDPFYNNWQTAIINGLKNQYNIAITVGGIDDLHKCDDEQPQLNLISQPSSCSNSCQLVFQAQAGRFNLKQLVIKNDGQILADGQINLDPNLDTQTVTYTYRPLEQSSDRNLRGRLEVELIDQALYVNSLNVSLNIDNFPTAQPVNSFRLLSAEIDSVLNTLSLTWNQAQPNLRVNFSDNCSDLSPRSISSNQTSIIIPLGQIQSETCEVHLSNDQLTSNALEFEIP